MTLGLIAELKHLPDSDEEGGSCINGEGCIQERHIGCIAWWIVSQTMVDKHQSGQLP